jgi:hypothetical protein
MAQSNFRAVMENETHSGGDTMRNDVPATERVTADVREQVQAQSSRAADSAQHAPDAARQAADRLRGQEARMAGLVKQGADRLAELAQTLRNSDAWTMLTQFEDFARRQPVLFAGAAMAFGFALTRAAGMTATAARSAGTTQEGSRYEYR